MSSKIYDSSKMEYRYLGNSGLRVSILGFGIMFHENVENLKEILTICLKNGINFFDTAEAYGKKNNRGKNKKSRGRKCFIKFRKNKINKRK